MKVPRSEGAKRSAKCTKVYVGFWTWPETKDALKRLSAKNRQSMSAYIDGVVDDHLARSRWGHR